MWHPRRGTPTERITLTQERVQSVEAAHTTFDPQGSCSNSLPMVSDPLRILFRNNNCNIRMRGFEQPPLQGRLSGLIVCINIAVEDKGEWMNGETHQPARPRHHRQSCQRLWRKRRRCSCPCQPASNRARACERATKPACAKSNKPSDSAERQSSRLDQRDGRASRP